MIQADGLGVLVFGLLVIALIGGDHGTNPGGVGWMIGGQFGGQGESFVAASANDGGCGGIVSARSRAMAMLWRSRARAAMKAATVLRASE